MTQTSGLDEVGLINLTYLLAVSRVAARDPATASYLFSLPIEVVREIASLGVDAIEGIALSSGRALVSLSLTQSKLRELATYPTPLAFLLSSSRASAGLVHA